MQDTQPIAPSLLLIDLQNPRIPYAADNQRDAIRAIASLNNEWLLNLADSIVEHGLNPSDLPIVMLSSDQPQFFVVLEGNRRLTALRALENPELFNDALTPSILDKIRKLSARYQNSPVAEIRCYMVNQREDADYWIRLRHTGRNAGAGLVDWNSDQSSRFYARAGGAAHLHTRLLDFLEARGHLSATHRQEIPVTNFRRLVETPEYRASIGIQVAKDGGIRFLTDEESIVENLMYTVRYVCLPDTKVADIYTKDRRIALAQTLPRMHSGDQPAPPTSSSTRHRSAGATAVQPSKRVNLTRMKRQRDRLIPPDCPIRVTSPRIKRMETELRSLGLTEYRNAVSVLFRVFIELSLDAYIGGKKLPDLKDPSLRAKLQQVTDHLIATNKLTKAQATPVRRACSKDSFLAPSMTLLHQYVHALHVFPAAGDLRDHWDSLQPFISAVWPL
jgi:hypothetical protein